MSRRWITPILIVLSSPIAVGQFSFNLIFAGGLTLSQQETITSAASVWESYITGYQPGINRSVLDVTISASPIDDQWGVLGSGGPDTASSVGGFVIANEGVVTLDSADLTWLESTGRLGNLAIHELGHALGFGTLWTHNNVYTDGTGQYTGAFGLAAYRDEFDPFASYVPVELEGGSGTEDSHWDEAYGGTGLTGITDAQGRDLANAMMTGWTGPDPPLGGASFLSNTTVMSLRDIGFEVHLAPEPGTALLLLVTASGALVLRRRSSRPSLF